MENERIDLGEIVADGMSRAVDVETVTTDSPIPLGRYRVWAEKIPEPTLAERIAKWFAGCTLGDAHDIAQMLEEFDLVERPNVSDEIERLRGVLEDIASEQHVPYRDRVEDAAVVAARALREA